MDRVGSSREWGVVKAGRHNYFLDLLESTFRPIGKFVRLQWLLGAIIQLELAEDVKQFGILGSQAMDERLNVSKWGSIGGMVRLELGDTKYP